MRSSQRRRALAHPPRERQARGMQGLARDGDACRGERAGVVRDGIRVGVPQLDAVEVGGEVASYHSGGGPAFGYCANPRPALPAAPDTRPR